MVIDSCVCDEAQNIGKLLSFDSVQLSLVHRPYYEVGSNSSKHIELIKDVLKHIASVTKVGGVCCLITSSDMKPENQGMDLTETKALLASQDDPEISSKWVFYDKILWVKSPKKAVESLNPMEEISMVSFDETPFSIIEVLIRSDSNEDFKESTIPQRINNLKISSAKKMEMLEPFWYISPKSEPGYKDYFPKELIARLVMIFSKEGDLILDPFAGHGITAIAAKTLNRHYFCIEKNSSKVIAANKRIKLFNKI